MPENFVHFHINHFRWDADFLQLSFPMSNEYQVRDIIDVPWHVYPNNLNPHLCPILTSAKYLFYTVQINSYEEFFPGEFQYEMFLKIFCKAIRENAEDFNRLAVQVRYIGLHPNHKEKWHLFNQVALFWLLCPLFVSEHAGVWAPWKIDAFIKKMLTTIFLEGASLAFHPQFRYLSFHLRILILQKFLLAQKII